MAPIEVLFGAMVLLFALIGLVRGFLRELGVLLGLLIVLSILNQFEPHFDQGFVRAMDIGDGIVASQNQAGVQSWMYVGIIMVTAFVSYAGERLSFGGGRLSGAFGIGLGLLIGALNGYLIAGSIWYYLDKWDYAIASLAFSQEGLSEVARRILPYLPLNFLGQPFLLGISMLVYLTVLLLIARMIR